MTTTDRLSEMECRRSAEKASREFAASRAAERAARKERNIFIAGVAILVLTMASYAGFRTWDDALNAETDRIMEKVEFDANGYRIFPASFDGRVWLSRDEKSGRFSRPSLLGK